MNCNEATKIINDYFDGLLSNEEKLDMEYHISECTNCKHEFALYSNLCESIKLLPMNINTPKKLAKQIFDELTEQEETTQTKTIGVLNKLKSKILKK
jgi:anti-sigma factor RsiW